MHLYDAGGLLGPQNSERLLRGFGYLGYPKFIFTNPKKPFFYVLRIRDFSRIQSYDRLGPGIFRPSIPRLRNSKFISSRQLVGSDSENIREKKIPYTSRIQPYLLRIVWVCFGGPSTEPQQVFAWMSRVFEQITSNNTPEN